MWLMFRTIPGGAGGGPGFCPLPCDPLAGTAVPIDVNVVPALAPEAIVTEPGPAMIAPGALVVWTWVVRFSEGVNWPVTDVKTTVLSVGSMLYVRVWPFS